MFSIKTSIFKGSIHRRLLSKRHPISPILFQAQTAICANFNTRLSPNCHISKLILILLLYPFFYIGSTSLPPQSM